jgi:predicted transcriptional regulator
MAQHPTPLAAHLARTGLKQQQFAELLGAVRGWPVKQAAISMWASGKRKPSGVVRAAIERASGGAVRVDAWDSWAVKRRRRS